MTVAQREEEKRKKKTRRKRDGQQHLYRLRAASSNNTRPAGPNTFAGWNAPKLIVWSWKLACVVETVTGGRARGRRRIHDSPQFTAGFRGFIAPPSPCCVCSIIAPASIDWFVGWLIGPSGGSDEWTGCARAGRRGEEDNNQSMAMPYGSEISSQICCRRDEQAGLLVVVCGPAEGIIMTGCCEMLREDDARRRRRR